MRPGFSERQYELAVNFELIRGLNALLPSGLPEIPTTVKEAELGYDAKFDLGDGWLYFLQYKVVHSASRRTHWNTHFWDAHGGAYFRFDLLFDEKSDTCRQHLALERLRRSCPGVFYCAPNFASESDFWRLAGRREVFQNSSLIDVASVPLPIRSGEHAVSYDAAGGTKVWSEEGEYVPGVRVPEIRRETPRRRLDTATLRRTLFDLADALVEDEQVRERGSAVPGRRGDRASLIATRSGELQSRHGPESGALFDPMPVERSEDEAETWQLLEQMRTTELLTALGNMANLDLGATVVLEPAGG